MDISLTLDVTEKHTCSFHLYELTHLQKHTQSAAILLQENNSMSNIQWLRGFILKLHF